MILANFPNLGAHSEFEETPLFAHSRVAYCAADVASLVGRRMCPQNWVNQLPTSPVYVSVLRLATMVDKPQLLWDEVKAV